LRADVISSVSTLRETLARFEEHSGERLPVVDEQRMLVGSISKSDLLLTLSGTKV